MRKKVLLLLMLLSLSLSLSLNITVASAAGGITKTATSASRTCTGGSSTTKVSNTTCSNCGGVTGTYTATYCDTCGAMIYHVINETSHHMWNTVTYVCRPTPGLGVTAEGSFPHGTIGTGTYVNAAYGYSGTSSTFTVYPISVIANNSLTASVSVSGCTATDAAMSGKSVTVKVTGVSVGTKLKIANSGTGATTMPTAASTSYSYTFTMPATATTITVGLAQEAQSLSASLSSTTVGYGSKPMLTVIGAKTALSYSSSNTSVASIDSNGVITTTGLGSTTFTITAAETADYYSASTTVSLTVVKGDLSVRTVPNASAINYGQVLSSSALSGGSVTNVSGIAIGGTWSWKTPTTVPNAGKFAFVATYKPVDTAHYNY